MSKNIFINNLDTYVSQAIFKELRNDQPLEAGEEANPDAYNIFGTYISKDSSMPPEGIKKMLKRSKPNLAMTYISKCDLIVYDLHSGNPEDVQLALDAMMKPRPDDEPGQEKTIILISSLLAWDATPRNLEEVRSPQDIQEEEEQAKREAEAKAAADAKAKAALEVKSNEDAEVRSGDGDGEPTSAAKVDQSDVLSAKDGDAAKEEGEGEGEAAAAQEEEAQEEEPEPVVEAKRAKRKRYIHHPFTEKDYQKRKASAEYAKIKEVEDRVLNFKKEGVKTYVISAGVLYGLGEAIFNHHFERAWKQDPQKLPIVGEGKNFVPTIHVKDLARMVKKLFETPPETKYIFGIDNTKRPTQKKLIQAISDGIGTGLVESIDIPMEYTPVHPKQTPLNLHLDWKKFVMLNIKALPSKIFVPDVEGAGGDDGEAEADEGGEDASGFQWHCKNGLAGNIQRVKEEFCKERGLKPFKIGIAGKPCSGKSFYAAQLAKHYGVPHIHKEQVLHDIQNWDKEKGEEYHHRQSEKIRLAKLAEERAVEKAQQDEEERQVEEARKEEEKARKRAELGSEGEDANESEKEEVKSEKIEDAEPGDKPVGEGAEGGEEGAGEGDSKDDRQKNYEKQLKQLAEDEASSEDEFQPLELKGKINKYYQDNKKQKKIPQEMLSEAFRWRLSKNDCQNRGYILDGYPICYVTCNEVFFITPEKPAPKLKKVDEDGNEVADEDEPAEDVDPEELAKKYAPKFQSHIYPDSVILLRGKDEFLRKRAANLKPEDNTKWDGDNFERRIATYNQANDVNLFKVANNDPMLGHPKAKTHILPMLRFFQENKTEVFEIKSDGNTFEMFESMRVYIERSGRSYNYLSTVRVLNVKREEELVKEEKNSKAEKADAEAGEKNKSEAEKSALEKLQDGRLESIRGHMEELESTSNLNMRQFLMKQIIPVLTEGMIDVYRVGPTDPVDYLADYIFTKSNHLRKQVKTKKTAK